MRPTMEQFLKMREVSEIITGRNLMRVDESLSPTVLFQAELDTLKENGLVAIFHNGDGELSMEGAMNQNCYITADDTRKIGNKGTTVTAKCGTDGVWYMTPNTDCVMFDVMSIDDGVLWCKGIIIAVDSVADGVEPQRPGVTHDAVHATIELVGLIAEKYDMKPSKVLHELSTIKPESFPVVVPRITRHIDDMAGRIPFGLFMSTILSSMTDKAISDLFLAIKMPF